MKKEKLTKQQKDAIEYCDGPLLIVAGPGSGKTKVLTNKAIYLMNKLNLNPKEILMTTFTIKASEEMRSRIEEISKRDVSSMFIGTIHSLCDSIIKEHGNYNIYADYEVLDDFKRYLFLKKNLKNLNLNIEELKKIKRVQKDNELITLLSSFYDLITENMIDIDELKQELLNREQNELISRLIESNSKKNIEISVDEIKNLIKSLLDSYNVYLNLLKNHKYLDFSNLEAFAWKIIHSDKRVLKEIQNKYKYVLVDEFQDINPIQWKIIYKIIKEHKNIACVGDRNQSIYGFRGANPNIFDQFTEEFSNAKLINLDINFRSRKKIVDITNYFLENRDRKLLDLKNHKNEEGKIYSIVGETEQETAKKTLEYIKYLKENKIIKNYGDVAILFRSLKYHGKDYLNLLNKEYNEIPYSVFGGINFLNNLEIESILYLMSYVLGLDHKKEVKSITRIENFSDLFLKNIFDQEIKKEFEKLNWSAFSKIEDLIEKEIKKSVAEKIIKLNNLKEKIMDEQKLSLQNIFYEILGIIDIISFEKNEEYTKIIYNLGKFSKLLEDFVTVYNSNNLYMLIKMLNAIPDNLNLNQNNNDVELLDNNSLYLMNIHQAKGLEFPIVIIPSLIKKRIPNTKKTKPLLEIPLKFFIYKPYDQLKEEENLFYVAISRAEDALFLSYFKRTDCQNCNPSLFFEDVKEKLTEFNRSNLKDINISEKKEDSTDIKVINYSAISTFIDCPERFKINYIYGFKAAEIFQQKLGKIYHNALAKINQDLILKNEINEYKMDEFIKESWVDLGNKNEIFKKKIKKGLKRYLSFMKNELKEIISIEAPVNVSKNNIRIKGRTDLIYKDVNGNIVLMDYKARKLKAIEDTHVDMQLKFYADSLIKDGQKIDKAVAYPIDEENLNIKDAEFKIDNDESIKVILNNFIDCVKNKKYVGTKKGKTFCNACPYRHMCKHYKKVK